MVTPVPAIGAPEIASVPAFVKVALVVVLLYVGAPK